MKIYVEESFTTIAVIGMLNIAPDVDTYFIPLTMKILWND